MNKATLFLFAILFVPSAYANRSVTCQGENPGIESVQLTAQLSDSGEKSSSFQMKSLSKPSEPAWEAPNLNPRETEELFIGHGPRFNYFFGHHNTVITVTADADVFGYANGNESLENYTGFRGKLVLWTGPGENPKRKIFDIICKKGN